MYRYETHLHTVESSACGVTPGSEYPAIFKSRGYDGIFITDHFFHGNTRPSRELPWPEYVDAYTKGYEEAKKAGDAIGFKVFFGIEENFSGDEYLIYGVDKAFLLAHPDIPHWTREEMISWVHAAGGAVIQAHPFRDRPYIKMIHLHPEGIEGIEGINTANTANDNLAALCYALRHHLLIQAGSDTHDKAKIGEMNGWDNVTYRGVTGWIHGGNLMTAEQAAAAAAFSVSSPSPPPVIMPPACGAVRSPASSIPRISLRTCRASRCTSPLKSAGTAAGKPCRQRKS